MKETQLNQVEHTLEFNTHKKMLFEIITNLYMLYHKDEIYENMRNLKEASRQINSNNLNNSQKKYLNFYN